jgi:hypothetical protein
MDVICFLCVSLGSSTVQLHDSLGSRRAYACPEAGFSSQNGDHAWRVYYQRVAFCRAFLWAKGLNARDAHNELFPVHCRKHLSHKAFHNLVANVSLLKKLKRRCGSGLRRDKRLLCCGFRRTGKGTGQVYQCWWRICREIHVFVQILISHVLRFMSICDLFTDYPSYIQHGSKI